MTTKRDQIDPARVLRERIRESMAMHNRCDVEATELLKVWENRIDDDMGTVEDFMRWCGRCGWKAGREVTSGLTIRGRAALFALCLTFT